MWRPVRKLNGDALRSLLRGVRDGDDLPPVVVFREPGAGYRGVARWAAPLARVARVGLRVDTGDPVRVAIMRSLPTRLRANLARLLCILNDSVSCLSDV
jgi:hypothetical protein